MSPIWSSIIASRTLQHPFSSWEGNGISPNICHLPYWKCCEQSEIPVWRGQAMLNYQSLSHTYTQKHTTSPPCGHSWSITSCCEHANACGSHEQVLLLLHHLIFPHAHTQNTPHLHSASDLCPAVLVEGMLTPMESHKWSPFTTVPSDTHLLSHTSSRLCEHSPFQGYLDVCRKGHES